MSRNALVIFTLGYQQRDGADLIAALKDAGVEYLADVRERPISRKPEFRAKALRAVVEAAGIEYGPWPSLGAPKSDARSVEGIGRSAALPQEGSRPRQET